MATLLAVIRPGGRTQWCDARCYDAYEAHCECVCGGLNHGIGLATARENTRNPSRSGWRPPAHGTRKSYALRSTSMCRARPLLIGDYTMLN